MISIMTGLMLMQTPTYAGVLACPADVPLMCPGFPDQDEVCPVLSDRSSSLGLVVQSDLL